MRLIIDSDAVKVPRNCHECYLCYGGWCTVMPSEQDEMCPDEDRPAWCPLSIDNEPTKFEIKHAISNTDHSKGHERTGLSGTNVQYLHRTSKAVWGIAGNLCTE